jgi:hypothetical protein
MKKCKHDWKKVISEEKIRAWFILVFTSRYDEYYVCSKCGLKLK